MRKKVRTSNLKDKRKITSKTMTRFSGNKSSELMGFLMVLLGLFIAVSLFTYNANEIPDKVRVGQVTNGLGIVGVYIAHYLIRLTIGYPVLILPFIIVAWGINRFTGKSYDRLLHWTIFTALFAFYVSVSGALRDVIGAGGKSTEHLFSGFFGGQVAEILYAIFGQYGSVLVLIGLILVTVILSTEITIKDLFQSAAGFLGRITVSVNRLWTHYRSKIEKAKRAKRSLKIDRIQRPVEAVSHSSNQISFGTAESKVGHQEELFPQYGAVGESSEGESGEGDFKSSLSRVPQGEGKYEYHLPPIELLQEPVEQNEELNDRMLKDNSRLLEEKLADFDISARVIEINPGPVITRYELELAPGIKVSRITSLADDLAMAMRAKRIRIVAPIPGKAAVGVEIPNPTPEMVYLREILDSEAFKSSTSPLTLAIGKTISGKPYVTDLTNMPHLLVAGSTGSGKSVCLNTIIMSILYKAFPHQVQFVLIDPKRLELSVYAQLHRHYLMHIAGSKDKVATTAKSAIAVLKAVEQEMERRYRLLAAAGVRSLSEYNQRLSDRPVAIEDEKPPKPLEYLILIVDELADLMLISTAAREVEEPIARLTQMSRAVGIHLIVATQRPSVDVITGVIKANFPARIAFQVASKVDSRTILDMNGAEKLLGRGDMLFLPPASPEPLRLHNAFISLNEIENIVAHIKRQPPIDKEPLPAFLDEETSEATGFGGGSRDPLFNEAMKIVVRSQQGSVSILQRRLKVGYSRAARLIDELEAAGVVGPFEGSKARDVLMTPQELEDVFFDNNDEEF
jgi:S-DNA-T family DNA segregation ATPase FtsK/SpoIIIE